MTKEIIIKRLSIVKQLFEAGVKQSAQPEILSFSALLSFHDSIDMFMNLAAEKKGIKNRKTLFLMQHFDAIPELTLKASVSKINDRRNNLKHNGQIPAKIEIEESKSIAVLFFQENAPVIFGLEFSSITLASLISNDEIRKLVVEAEISLQNGLFQECIILVAKAYYKLEGVQRANLANEPFHNMWAKKDFYVITPEMTKEGKYYVKNPFGGEKFQIDEGQQWLNYIYKQNFGYILNILGYLFLGVNIRDMIRFKKIVPEIVGRHEDNLIASPIQNEDELTYEKTSFAFNFVIDFAIIVQAGL